MAESEFVELALDDARTRMTKSIESLKRELSGVRTGRAQPSLVEHLRIDYYGEQMDLIQLATVTAPEARLIVIQPWDKNAFDPISKAIQQSDLGLNPQSDGIVIRLAIPELTEERRLQLVKQVGQRDEDTRIAVRNVRRDCQDELRSLLKSKDISQDEERRAHDELEKVTHEYVEQVGLIGKEKEQELMEV
jgi:ribosome recycling factor